MDLPAFLDAGVDCVTIPVEMGKRVWQVLEHVRGRGKQAGISLELDTHIDLAKPYRTRVDTVVLMGTAMGVKGGGLDERACNRISAMRTLLDGYRVRLTADGGIREETVPLLRAAGADAIVPGSLMCNAADLAATAAWLRSLGSAGSGATALPVAAQSRAPVTRPGCATRSAPRLEGAVA